MTLRWKVNKHYGTWRAVCGDRYHFVKRCDSWREAYDFAAKGGRNKWGDVPCPKDGEYVNVQCWKCGWKRGASV